jgi:hypothetical protein
MRAKAERLDRADNAFDFALRRADIHYNQHKIFKSVL